MPSAEALALTNDTNSRSASLNCASSGAQEPAPMAGAAAHHSSRSGQSCSGDVLFESLSSFGTYQP